ncbi:MAG: LysR family transcriptional regulator, partial [Chloroflexota bacterium]
MFMALPPFRVLRGPCGHGWRHLSCCPEGNKPPESQFIVHFCQTIMAIDIAVGMRVFAAVVDAGSFAGAAERLDLSRGMATRYVAQLEAQLGARLLNRTTRSLSLTEAGHDYYQRATQILELIEEAERSVSRNAAVPRGVLRVATSIGFGVGHLDRAVADYLVAQPQVAVELTLNERAVDLVEEGFDIAVRIAVQADAGQLLEHPDSRGDSALAELNL